MGCQRRPFGRIKEGPSGRRERVVARREGAPADITNRTSNLFSPRAALHFQVSTAYRGILLAKILPEAAAPPLSLGLWGTGGFMAPKMSGCRRRASRSFQASSQHTTPHTHPSPGSRAQARLLKLTASGSHVHFKIQFRFVSIVQFSSNLFNSVRFRTETTPEQRFKFS